MVMGILTHTPYWVWGILVALVALGLAQTRDRRISLSRVTLLPLLFIALSLSGIFRHDSPWLALCAWIAGCAVTAVLARKAVEIRGASWSPTNRRFHVPGSWVPLPLMVGLFLLKYAVAVSQAMHPAFIMQTGPLIACNFLYGLFAGVFWSRSYSLRKLARGAPLAPPPAAAAH